MTFSTPESKAIPLWVTLRDTTGALLPSLSMPLSLSVGEGAPQPIEWSSGMGLCIYPLDTTACPSPRSLSVSASDSTIQVASTNPSSAQRLLPEGTTLLSNTVCSKTCLHFVAINPATGLISLASFRPSDLPAKNPSALVWSDIPSVGFSPSSVQIGLDQDNILICLSAVADILCYTGPTPEVVYDVLSPVLLELLPASPGYTGTIILATLLDSRPLLVTVIDAETKVWLPVAPNKRGLAYTLQAPDGGQTPTILEAVVTPTTPPRAWLHGIFNSAPIVVDLPLDTTIPTFYTNTLTQNARWTGMSVNPNEVFLVGADGLWKFSQNTWTALGGSAMTGVISTVWSEGDPWNPLPGEATPITIGVHTLVQHQNTIVNNTTPLTTQTLLTTEHLCFAELDEAPSWLVNTGVIVPRPLANPIWDDRILYDAPEHPMGEVGPTRIKLGPAPLYPSLTETSNVISPLDPTGSFIINLNIAPSPIWAPSGVTLFTDTQIFSAPYPSTKMDYPILSISLPKPQLALVSATYFPPTKLQSFSGASILPGTLPAVKAIVSGNKIYISLIALNTFEVYLNSLLTPLPPVLIDYVIPMRTGQTNLTLTLTNLDHSVAVTVPLVQS